MRTPKAISVETIIVGCRMNNLKKLARASRSCAMQLDVRTLVISLMLVAGVNSLVMLLALRYAIPDFFYIVVCNVLVPWGAGKIIQTTVSLGLAMSEKHASSWDELVQLADLAMYRVKSKGGNGVAWYEEEIKVKQSI